LHWKPSSPSSSSASALCSQAQTSNQSNGARGPATWSAAKRPEFSSKLVSRLETRMRSWRTGLGSGTPEARGRLLDCGLLMVRRVGARESIGVLKAMLGVDLAYSIDYMG
jgi:hypothetical protein